VVGEGGAVKTGSFCSGVAAPELAFRELGWEPQWFSEIDPFASAVLAHRYPTVPNLGDMTKIRSEDLATVDVLVAGTPCQSFSVAGLRKGLADPRGNLALVLLKHLDALRPRWLVWENVPGVLSSWSDAEEGEDGSRWQTNDFDTFLCGLRELGYGVAWRILDAQYFGVPQRRRRVFVVGHLGDWRPAAAVLFERDCLSGNPAPSRETGARIARSVKGGSRGGGGQSSSDGQETLIPQTVGCLSDGAHMGGGGTDRTPTPGGLSRCLNAGGMGRQDYETETLIPVTGGFFDEPTHALKAEGADASEDGTGRGTPIIPTLVDTLSANGDAHSGFRNDRGLVAYSVTQDSSPVLLEEQSPALKVGTGLEMGQPPCVAYNVQSQHSNTNAGHAVEADVARCLDGTGFTGNQGGTVIAFQERGRDGGRSCEAQEEIAYSLMAPNGGGRRQENNVAAQMRVRRLTPLECERLMNFPDGYTFIPYNGKPAKDGPRYKACGNSMVVACMLWIGRRIEMVEQVLGEHAKQQQEGNQ
jgi:DNA (cytosine-5)-methyltransferase 1